MADSLRIQERFVSLQGEGALVGTPSHFVRVSGCNLRCTWCDSPATSWSPEGESTAVATLVDACATGPKHVVVTGGEPLLFPAVATLCRSLRARGHHVTIETAGTVLLEDLECDLLSLSPKLAHSTPTDRAPSLAARHEARRWAPEVVHTLADRFATQLKFVVRAHDDSALGADVAEIESLLHTFPTPFDGPVFLMPECIDPARLPLDYARLVPVCTKTGFRLGQRLHIELFGHTPGT